MELQTPPIDTSWNSRSADHALPVIQITMPAVKRPNPKKSSMERPVLRTTLTAPSKRVDMTEPPNLKRPAVKPDPISAVLRSGSVSSQRRNKNPDTQQYDSRRSQPLRSAMVKNAASQVKRPSKSVRFALTRRELEKDASEPCLPDNPNNASSRPDIPANSHLDSRSKTSTSNSLPATSDQKKTFQRSLSVTQKPSWKSLSQTNKHIQPKARSHSVTIGSPLRNSMVAKPDSSTEAENMKTEFSGPVGSRRPTQSLGRHSLSRIIKGPMFSGRDNKRATISMGHGVDENAMRRESGAASDSLQKKSRMPVPLRNILTRFK
ncbi:hypothetical protein BDZ97DRAFT_1809064 [Flammula alnicola]|nr:hypothetical protein BDZ97DRAFT_1809064 [Flammula alnicola]